VHNHIRGLSPFPGAWFELEAQGNLERVKVLRSTLGAGDGVPGETLDDALTIACGSGAVRLTHIQRAGKKTYERAGVSARAVHSHGHQALVINEYEL